MAVAFMRVAWTGAAFLALAGVLVALHRLPGARLPQGRTGEDILSVLLGDAKKDISDAMIRTADSYFHGGVDIDCHLGDHDHAEHACTGKGDCPRHGRVHHDGEDGSGTGVDQKSRRDPWQWINGCVRAPEVDRHLEREKAKEMLPWFWMAVRSNPHNTEAWTTAWFAAASLMKDAKLAQKVAEEAHRANPDALDVLCVLGRSYRLEGIRDDEKAIAAFSELREKALRTCDGNPGKLSDGEKSSFLQALDYLSVYAADRRDESLLKHLLGEARQTDANHATTANIAHRLGSVTP